MRSASRAFAATFAACLLVQGWVWGTHPTPDHYWIWVDGVQLYASGSPYSRPHLVHQYPATTILEPAGALTAAGMSADLAFRGTMVFLITLAAALTAAVAFALRPRSPWWIFVAWLIVLQPLCMIATAPTALVTLLAALYALLILVARERAAFSTAMLGAIGICGGVMLATRLDVSGVFVAAGALYLAWQRPAAWYVMPLFAAATFLLSAPHALAHPVEHVFHILSRVQAHTEQVGHSTVSSSVPFASPFGGAALLLTALLVVTRRLRAFPVDFAVFLMAVSIFITLALLLNRHHPQWLFFPAFLIWELLLPLVVTDGLRSLRESNALRVLLRPGTNGTALALAYMLYQCWIFWFQLA